MASHLIIGLGGTGGKVLRELRKRIFKEFHSNEPTGEQGKKVYMDYLYVDSSKADLENRTDWKVLGKSVHLGKAQKVDINGISTSFLSNLGMYPGLQSFINPSDKALAEKNLGPLITAGIGGQRRRLGRMLMAYNISNKDDDSNFVKVLEACVGRLQRASGDNDVTFHICAGLAGGTGSGSIIDVISQIRKRYQYVESTGAFKIRLFLYMPEMHMVHAAHDSGYYQANGYAALQELNAMSVGEYHPLDVSGDKDIFTQEVQRLMQGKEESFEAAYIYSNVNEKGKILDLGLGLPAAVADFLFQTIVASEMNDSRMKRLVGCENDGAGPEADSGGKLTRSRKFLSFGIARVEYPETEIEGYFTYTFALQVARQMLYNFWQGGIGFGDRNPDEIGVGFKGMIKDNKKNRERLHLSDSSLTLGRAIVEDEYSKRWRDFNITWEERSKQDAGFVMAKYEKKYWLAKFSKLAADYFDSSFRGHGVKEFFEIQRQELKPYARHICRHVEQILFDEWHLGGENGKSLLEVEKYVQLLRTDCKERIAFFQGQIARHEAEKAKSEQDIKDAIVEWDRIGWLREGLTKVREKVFARYTSAKCRYYTCETLALADDYAISLLQQLQIQFNTLLTEIRGLIDKVDDVAKVVYNQADSRCRKNGLQDSSCVYHRYDPEVVRAQAKLYVSDKKLQDENAAQIRNAMVAELGEDEGHSFVNLCSRLDYDTVMSIIMDNCTKSARRAMKKTADEDPLLKMVNVNILDNLSVELNDDEKLEMFVNDIVDAASSFVEFSREQETMDNEIASTKANGQTQTMVQLVLPEADSEASRKFKDRLLKKMVENVTGFTEGMDVSTNYRNNSIVVVCARAGFPLRYLLSMKTLKGKYDSLVNDPNDKEINRMVLHTESFSEPLPLLFDMDGQELLEHAKKPLMLAFALNLIEKQQNPVTGESFYAMSLPGQDLGDMWIKFGKSFAGCLSLLGSDRSKFSLLENRVKHELAEKAVSNDQKIALTKQLGVIFQQMVVPEMCENNQYSPEYGRWRKLAVEIIDNELKTL